MVEINYYFHRPVFIVAYRLKKVKFKLNTMPVAYLYPLFLDRRILSNAVFLPSPLLTFMSMAHLRSKQELHLPSPLNNSIISLLLFVNDIVVFFLSEVGLSCKLWALGAACVGSVP